jgi:hypothetical protein
MKRDNEYIKIKTHAHLIGKRAKFKNNLNGYSAKCWNQKGIIIQHKGLEHIGLSLKFDKPLKLTGNNNWIMETCYIQPDSYEVLE